MLCAAAWPSPAIAKSPPVVVLGFDGADARLVEQWMESGDLPNLAALRRDGVFAPLVPTNPPQTPVSWASFSTGLSPGSTGVFDFLMRNPDDYMPDFAMNSPVEERVLFGQRNPLVLGAAGALIAALLVYLMMRIARLRNAPAVIAGIVVVAVSFPLLYAAVSKHLPQKRPGVVSHRKGATFWEIAGDAGLRTVIMHVPGTFPVVPARNGRLLSGLGVPDMRGTFGTYTYYTTSTAPTRSGADTEMGGKVVVLDRGRAEYKTIIYGPQNKLFGRPPEIQLPLTIRVDRAAGTVSLSAAGQNSALSAGQWSDWFVLEFPFSRFFKANGIARFYLIEAAPELKLYMSSVNWNPMKPPLPISVPGAFARDLAERFGLYKTVGWVEDTWALNEEVIEEHAYEEDVDRTVAAYEKMMLELLEERDYDLYVQVYSFTDRSAHMYWRTMDEGSPLYTPEVAAAFGDAIKASYVRMDGIIGKARALLPPDVTLIVCSDHGFSTWRRSVNYNTWLVENGYMTLRDEGAEGMHTLEDLFGRGEFWPNVDWENTRAYALGLGAIYINLSGRERNGIVTPGAEYDALLAEIQSKLEAFTDSATGERPVKRVYRRDEMYREFDGDVIPDLRAGNNLGYRVSWQTSLGGIPKGNFSDNARKWSGDHCSLDPSLVPGIFVSNRRFETAGAAIPDLFPTILSLLHLPVPTGIDGRTLQLTEGTASRALP